MTEMSNKGSYLNLDSLQAHLATKIIGRAGSWENEVFDTIDSTNARARQLAELGAPEGVIVAARQQSAGRGRLGRSWVSPLDAGVYVSFLLRPSVQPSSMSIYTLAAGVASAGAIAQVTGVTIGLKWVNDLVYDRRKVGGILSELVTTEGAPHAVPNRRALIIGCGINLCLKEADLPAELFGKVDWLERICRKKIDANILVAELALQLEEVCQMIAAGNTAAICDRWRGYAVMLGQPVKVISENATYEGVACDIDATGALIVDKIDGEKVVLHAGEISVRGVDGGYV